MKTKIFIAIALVLVGIQFIRVDQTNPPVEANLDFINVLQPSAEVENLLKNACYDCHSYETKYPWYFNVAPLSFWLKGHVNGGRKHLNFSEWGNYSEKKADHKIEETIEKLENRWMPLASYTWTHEEAKLSDEDNQLLIEYFKSLEQ